MDIRPPFVRPLHNYLALCPDPPRRMRVVGRRSKSKRLRFRYYDVSVAAQAVLCKELSDRYLAVNNFTFWEHSKGTGQLSLEEVQKGEFDIIFTHATYHTQHCLFLWDKQIKAANSRRPILDSITRSQHHLEHCLRILTAHTAENYTSTETKLFKAGTPIH
ncbi:hypothetical protein DL95DRAFT_482247, partial [Leptodontidium sp. 2 PMI_412]